MRVAQPLKNLETTMAKCCDKYNLVKIVELPWPAIWFLCVGNTFKVLLLVNFVSYDEIRLYSLPLSSFNTPQGMLYEVII
jgi:hypothetical protein